MTLTAAMEHDLQVRGITDASIDREELRQRAAMREQAALHLADLRREHVTPLKSFWQPASSPNGWAWPRVEELHLASVSLFGDSFFGAIVRILHSVWSGVSRRDHGSPAQVRKPAGQDP
jgi:hypothetical protein